jgi:hypothetical protein
MKVLAKFIVTLLPGNYSGNGRVEMIPKTIFVGR